MPRTFLALLLTTAALGVPHPTQARQQAKPRREFSGVKGPIRNVAFSPDGKSVAAGVFADHAHVWDVATGKRTRAFKGGHSIAVAFAPDGKGIVTLSGGNGLLLW